MHTHTPTLTVWDARGHAVRNVAYLRNERLSPVARQVTQQQYDARGHLRQCRDPRLFDSNAPANLRQILSLSGTVLLSDSVDAGPTVLLMSEAKTVLERWDAKLNHSRIQYDELLRPVALYETTHGDTQKTSDRRTYAYSSPESAQHNRCGRLLRHDDTAGTLYVADYSLTGEPLEQSRRFLNHLDAPDWPLDEAASDRLLEPVAGAVTSIHYNAVGDLLEQTDALGNTQRCAHTLTGQIHQIHLALAKNPQVSTLLLSAIEYNAAGQIQCQTAGNGVVTQAFYAPDDGRLAQMQVRIPGKGTVQDLNYEHDAVGNILSITDRAVPIRYFRNQRVEDKSQFHYDTLNRLISASGKQQRNHPFGPHLPPFQPISDPGQVENYTRTYRYDSGNNLDRMTQTTGHAPSHALAIAPFNNRGLSQKPNGQLPSAEEIAAAHDANGNLKELQPGQHLHWDMRNQLRLVEQVVREEAANDNELYIYNSAGQRERKLRTTKTSRAVRTHEVRYLTGVEVRESPEETLHVITVPAGLCQVQVRHWARGGPDPMGEDHVIYSVLDHLGSTCLELDATANLISREVYYPYGGTAYRAGGNAVQGRYKTRRYCGKERDATGLYYYGRRYYAPWLRRWISADPAGTKAGLNLYAMVNGNPISNVDEQGLLPVPSGIRQFGQSLNAGTSAMARAIGRGTSRVASAFSRPRVQAAAAAAIRDSMATYISNAIAAGVDQVFEYSTPTRAGNDALRYTVAALDVLAVGYLAGGLAGNAHSSAAYLAAPALGLAAGIGYALQQAQDDTVEEQWDPIARARLGGHIRAISRELMQQVLRGVGTSSGWGSTPLPQRLGRTAGAASMYGLATVPNALFNSAIPNALLPNVSPWTEGYDGAAGTLIRSGREGATFDAPGDVIQAPDGAATLPNMAGRMVNQAWGYWAQQGIEAAASAITGSTPADQSSGVRYAVSAARGVASALTEFRGWLVQAARNGYANTR